jgi:hypothetical protein
MARTHTYESKHTRCIGNEEELVSDSSVGELWRRHKRFTAKVLDRGMINGFFFLRGHYCFVVFARLCKEIEFLFFFQVEPLK